MRKTLVAPHDVPGYIMARFPAISRTSTRTLMTVWEALPYSVVCDTHHLDLSQCYARRDSASLEAGDCTYSSQFYPSTLMCSRSFDNGDTWEEPRPFASGDVNAHIGFHEPSFLLDRVTGRLFCFYSRSQGEDANDSDAATSLIVSWTDDDGLTWNHKDVTSMIIGGRDLTMANIPRGRGTQLTSGQYSQRLCHGGVVIDANGDRRAVFIGSDDQGITWWSSRMVGSDVDYCSVVQNTDGDEVILLIKTRQSGAKLWAKSTDGGRTFGEPIEDPDYALISLLSPLEEVFYGAKPDSPHAGVVTYVGERNHCSGACTVLMLSTDNAATFAPAAWFDAKTYGTVDVASLPDLSRFIIVYESPQGIMSESLPFAKLPIAKLAKEWEEQA